MFPIRSHLPNRGSGWEMVFGRTPCAWIACEVIQDRNARSRASNGAGRRRCRPGCAVGIAGVSARHLVRRSRRRRPPARKRIAQRLPGHGPRKSEGARRSPPEHGLRLPAVASRRRRIARVPCAAFRLLHNGLRRAALADFGERVPGPHHGRVNVVSGRSSFSAITFTMPRTA